MKIQWRKDRLPTPVFLGFPCVSAGKESTCNAGDLGLISGLGISPGEGKGYPLQYSGLKNSMDCIVHGFTKSLTQRRDFHWWIEAGIVWSWLGFKKYTGNCLISSAGPTVHFYHLAIHVSDMYPSMMLGLDSTNFLFQFPCELGGAVNWRHFQKLESGRRKQSFLVSSLSLHTFQV